MSFTHPFRLRSRDQLCVIGVTGTGRTGLVKAIQRHVALEQTYRANAAGTAGDSDAQRPRAMDRWRLIHGELGYDIYRVLNRRPVFLALLRRPLDRALDLFSREHTFCGTMDTADPADWEDAFLYYVCDPANAPAFVNPQTRCIAVGLDPKDPAPADAVMLEMAKIHLEEFGFFAIAERAGESVQLLDYTFGWLPPHQAPSPAWVPASPAAGRLRASTIRAVNERMACDVELYDFACELFQWRYTLMLTRLLRASFAQNWWGHHAGRMDCWRFVDRLSQVPGTAARTAMRLMGKMAGA